MRDAGFGFGAGDGVVCVGVGGAVDDCEGDAGGGVFGEAEEGLGVWVGGFADAGDDDAVGEGGKVRDEAAADAWRCEYVMEGEGVRRVPRRAPVTRETVGVVVAAGFVILLDYVE